MNHNIWYRGKVIQGNKLGRILGYPTLNLFNPQVLSKNKEGVYVVRVLIEDNQFYGVLFFGSRLILNENNKIVEIFLFDFNQQIYGTIIDYQLISYLRKPANFSTTKALQNQIKTDIKTAKEIIRSLQSN